PVLSQALVRHALSHAIDKETIFRDIQKGRGLLATGPVPPGVRGYVQRPQQYPYDVRRAKELLKQAGHENLELELWYREEPLNAEIAHALKASLKEAG